MTTFLENALKFAEGRPVARTITVRRGDDLRDLSYYTICALADTIASNPFHAIEARNEIWLLDLDAEGNYLRAECLGRAVPAHREEI